MLSTFTIQIIEAIVISDSASSKQIDRVSYRSLSWTNTINFLKVPLGRVEYCAGCTLLALEGFDNLI